MLDPFSGKGTAPLEACISGRIGIGNDLAPEAYVLTHAKVRPVSLSKIKGYLKKVEREMDLQSAKAKSVNGDVKIFFHPETLKQIVALQKVIQFDDSDEGIFIKALMCGILHGASEISLSLPCSHSFSMSPAYVRRYAKNHKLRRPRRDVINCLGKKAENVLRDKLPEVRGEAYHKDVTEIPLEKESVDLIVTSPPYFNKQTYPWDNWLRLWFLGYDYKEVRKSLFQTGSKIKFIEFMTKALEGMYEILKNNSACFIVIGDVKLNDEVINPAELLAQPAESVGFNVKRIINDAIPKGEKYFMFIPADKGVRLDRILELHKGEVHERRVNLPWNSQSSCSLTQFFQS